MDDDKTVMRLHKEQKKHIERETKRNRDQDDRDPDNENNGGISMHRLSDKKKSARKAEDFGGNSNLASYDDKDALKSELIVTLVVGLDIELSSLYYCAQFIMHHEN